MKIKRLDTFRPAINTNTAQPLGSRQREITGRVLQRQNERLMRRNPWCVKCAEVGKRILVAEWDHIVRHADGGSDDDSNKQGLCLAHHREKSARENEQARQHGPTC